MRENNELAKIRLPKDWPSRVKSSVLHVMSLARWAALDGWSAAAVSDHRGNRLRADHERLKQELTLLREELRIKDSRMGRIEPAHRPRYVPTDRLAILELRASRGWTLTQTSKRFLVTAATIATWRNRLDEQGPRALVQTAEPVNRFPDFVRYMVRRLKVMCPVMGKQKMAETLCRAGLHIGTTTVSRILKEEPTPTLTEEATSDAATGGEANTDSRDDVKSTPRVVTAKYPNHVWHVDLTVAPTLAGFWVPWVPFTLPQCWPFCWWVAVALDHYSRRVMACGVFKQPPTSADVQRFLSRATSKAGQTPKYVICDKGCQFWCDRFKTWCKRKGIKPRYGAVGQHGSLAVIERFILTLKENCTRRILVPLQHETFRRELRWFADWYNRSRPHSSLGGKTPNEVYFAQRPACRRPRFEPRSRWPRSAPCACPRVLVKGQPGVRLQLELTFQHGRKHLPIVSLRRAA